MLHLAGDHRGRDLTEKSTSIGGIAEWVTRQRRTSSSFVGQPKSAKVRHQPLDGAAGNRKAFSPPANGDSEFLKV
jgi:hypothetical protein